MINGNRTKSERGRSPRDFYETPLDLAHASINDFIYDEQIDLQYRHFVLDPGCGNGIWGKALYSISHTEIVGVDTNPNINPNYVTLNSPYRTVIEQDYLDFKSVDRFDWVMGNPPYSLAEEFIRHSFELLYVGGYLFFLLRLSFLEGIDRGKNLFKQFPIKRVYVCSRRPSFFSTSEGKHTTDTLAYAMFLWQKGWTGKTELDWLDWEYSK